MDGGAQKLVESATQRTLHAHNFSRTSSQASLVLTDLLSRYLQLLTSTCGKYAEHAGRRRLCARDVVNSLAELGLSLGELEEYVKEEGYELGRYAIRSFRRIEDLNEYRAHLQHGLKLDRDDFVHLQYQPFDGDEFSSDSEEEMLVSPPPSPPRKRARTSDWDPPDHIPDFLPPFPTEEESSVQVAPKVERPSSPIPQTTAEAANAIAVATAASASAPDISTRVPYSQSSLASVPEWHLPEPSPTDATPPSKENVLPTPLLDPSLTAAYLHILKNPPSPTLPPPNPSRHRVAMNLLGITQTAGRWDVADTLYGNSAPNAPRVAPTGPSYAVPLGTYPFLDRKVVPDLKLPSGVPPRSIGSAETLVNHVAAQSSRIPELARCVLPPPLLHRVTRIGHPPVLGRGNKQLTYGPGAPAPWNSSTPQEAAPPTPLSAKVNGLGKGEVEKPALPDARLFATWEYESKDFRVPLHLPSKQRTRLGSQSGMTTRRDSLKEGRPTITLKGVGRI